MQRPDTECTDNSVYLKTCLRWEIDPLSLIEANSKAFISSSESSITSPSSIYYWFGIFKAEKFDSGCGINQLRYNSFSIRLSKDKLRNLDAISAPGGSSIPNALSLASVEVSALIPT
jgi:hypothetical protein